MTNNTINFNRIKHIFFLDISISTLVLVYLFPGGYINNRIASDCLKIGSFLTHFLWARHLYSKSCCITQPPLLNKMPNSQKFVKNNQIFRQSDATLLLIYTLVLTSFISLFCHSDSEETTMKTKTIDIFKHVSKKISCQCLKIT